MCGRYRSQQTDPDEFAHRFGPRYGPDIADALGKLQVRPTEQIAIVWSKDGERQAQSVRWGVQPPNSKRPLINARDDKVRTQPLWSKLLRRGGGRVLIPADGWYEWLAAEDPKAKKQPFLHTVDGGAPFAFAGLLGYAIVKDELVPAATIITTDSAGDPARIHDRQPVVLPDEDAEEAWLTGDDPDDLAEALLVPLPPGRVHVEPVTL